MDPNTNASFPPTKLMEKTMIDRMPDGRPARRVLHQGGEWGGYYKVGEREPCGYLAALWDAFRNRVYRPLILGLPPA